MSILGGGDAERLRHDAERVRDLEEGYRYEPRSTSGGRPIEQDSGPEWRELLDRGLRLIHAAYLVFRDVHFALYWVALAGPAKRAPLATAEAQQGHDRTAWEDVVLEVSAHDLRRLVHIVTPVTVLVSLIMLIGRIPEEYLATGVGVTLLVVLLAAIGVQVKVFARQVRTRLDVAAWRTDG